MPVVKELYSKWIVEMFDYISSNPHMIINGFLQTGISKALSKAKADDIDPSSSDDTVTNDTTSEQHSSKSFYTDSLLNVVSFRSYTALAISSFYCRVWH